MKLRKLNCRLSKCELIIESVIKKNKSICKKIKDLILSLSLETTPRKIRTIPIKMESQIQQKPSSMKTNNLMKLDTQQNLMNQELEEIEADIYEEDNNSGINDKDYFANPRLLAAIEEIKSNPCNPINLGIQKVVKRIGYITICSSVATSGRDSPKIRSTGTEGKKSVLFGTADDVENFDKYLKTKGSLLHRQAKYEFSSESLNAASKDEFLRSLTMFFDSPFNEASLIYYSGHGLANTSLVFETASENYHIIYYDIVSRWKSRNNRKNRMLIIVLDCCYSGSWVLELLKNGDFKDISIQCSSTIDQKSNDLGEGKGSLFTAFLTVENGYSGLPKLNYKDQSIHKLMTEQTPRAFVGEWGCGAMLFSNLNFNAWQDALVKGYIQSFEQEGLRGNCVIQLNRKDGVFAILKHLILIVEEESLIMQGEMPIYEEDAKINFTVSMNSKKIPNNYVGYISLWEEEKGKMKGIFFRVCNNKEYPFRVSNDTIDSTTESIVSFILKKSEISEDGLLQIIKNLTEINKSNLIQDFDSNALKDDDEEEEELEIFEMLSSTHKNKLETLSIEGRPNPESLKQLFSYINSKSCSVKKLRLSSHEILDETINF